eukprot:326491_1
MKTMPPDIIPLYGNFFDAIDNDSDDEMEYYSIDNIFLFIKEKYPPPCDVESELTAPYKYKIILKSFVRNNNSPIHNNVSFMNNRIREFIVKANPLNYAALCRQILL